MESNRSDIVKDVPVLPFESEHFHAEYLTYFRHKRGNFFRAVGEFSGLWECFQLLSDIWFREMADLQTASSERHMLPKTLFTAAHARFLNAMELGFSCCIGDAYSILRDGIEAVTHAYKIFKEPELAKVWAETGTADYKKAFEEKKKENLFPDECGLRRLHEHYARFSEAATHTNPTSIGKQFEAINDGEKLSWKFHYFETDPRKLAVLLFALLDASALMESVFFCCFEPRLHLDHVLVEMRRRFAQQKEQQRQYLRSRYSFETVK
jgi:hypothetical protein